MSINKANILIIKAEKRLNAWSFGDNSKYEDAAEIYENAANIYKINKNWALAGDIYKKVSECHMKGQSKYEAAKHLVNSANCYKNMDLEKAIKYIRSAIELYIDEGQFNQVGKLYMATAVLLEKSDPEKAINDYRLAAECYDGEGSSLANKCWLKVASLSAEYLQEYEIGIKIYEKLALKYLDNNSLKWGTKDLFIKSVLYYVAMLDLVAADRAINLYEEMDVSFIGTHENKFLRNILESVKDYNVQLFTDIVAEYDVIYKLNNHKILILLLIKKNINDDESDDETIDLR